MSARGVAVLSWQTRLDSSSGADYKRGMNSLRIAVAASCLNLPLREILPAAAEIGAQGLQFDARNDLRPDELSETGRRQFLKVMAESNLAVSSLSFASRRSLHNLEDLDRRIAAIKTAMQFAAHLGTQVLTLRAGRIPSDPESIGYLTLRDVMNDIVRHGNHIGVVAALTPCGDSPAELSRLLNDITTGPVGIDFDPAGLVITGHSPVKAVRELHQWVFHIQARDGLQDVDGSGIEVPLGRGELDWQEFIATLDEINYRGWITATRTTGEDRAGDVARAIKYLRSLKPRKTADPTDHVVVSLDCRMPVLL